MFINNINLNKHLLNANIIQQSILITKLKKSDLPNVYIKLQKTIKFEFTNFENLYNNITKPY